MFYCSRCSVFDEKGTLLTHRCSASNRNPASNNASDRIGPASNTVRAGVDAKAAEPAPGVQQSAVRKPVGVVPKQRWDREKYNAYQREYMRKRRESNN